MSLQNPVIAVIGAGAVGGYYGARLIQHGQQVHLLTRSDVSHIRRYGLRIQSCDGDFTLPPGKVNVYDDPKSMPEADLILITIKTTANDILPRLIEPIIKPSSILLTLQNGLGNEELLGKHFGMDCVMGGLAFVCINRTGPGEIAHTDHGLIRIGEPHAGQTQRARAIADLFNSSKIRCEVLESLTFGRWDKLVWNIPFNGLGAALDLTTDKLIHSDAGVRLVRTLCREVIAACRPLNLHFNLNVPEEKIRHTQTMGPYKTSMQIDRQACRPMEVDAIIGRPLEFAKSNGIATPYLEMLYAMLLALDSGTKCHS